MLPLMTIILGHRGNGFCTLAADSRRSDQITHETKRVCKLHKLSNQIILAQGGAGTGAADDVVTALKRHEVEEAVDISSYIEIVKKVAPPIMEKASSKWNEQGRKILPTRLILASIDAGTGIGIHVSILLNSLDICCFSEPGPYFTGSKSESIEKAASVEWFRRMEDDNASLAFDDFAISVTKNLEHDDANGIGLPVDVGIIRVKGDEYECVIRKGLSLGHSPEAGFLLTL